MENQEAIEVITSRIEQLKKRQEIIVKLEQKNSKIDNEARIDELTLLLDYIKKDTTNGNN
jgi:hypothetical protein